MHIKSEAELLPLDTEIERTLKNLRKATSAEDRSMANQIERLQIISEEEEAERQHRPNTMEEFLRPIIQEEYSVVRQSPIEANNFELKPALITMVQKHQFTGHPSEDPNEHLGRFKRMENTVKLNGLRPDVIKLQLFPFSLRDLEATWFDSLPVGSVNTWEEMVEAFMSRFFPPALTVERRGEIIVFKKKEDESLYTAWERFKRLLKRCPMHGIDLTTQMDIFYHAMNYTSKGIIDASCCGGFKRRSAEEARKVIEDLAKCNYKTPSEYSRSSSRIRGNGLIELDRTTAIEVKLDAVMNKLSSNERRMHIAHDVGAVRKGWRNSAEGYEEEEPYQVEETKYMNEQRSYHFKPNPNLPTHYSPTLRNHESFSYGGEAQQCPKHGQNHHQVYTQPRIQQQQQQ